MPILGWLYRKGHEIAYRHGGMDADEAFVTSTITTHGTRTILDSMSGDILGISRSLDFAKATNIMMKKSFNGSADIEKMTGNVDKTLKTISLIQTCAGGIDTINKEPNWVWFKNR